MILSDSYLRGNTALIKVENGIFDDDVSIARIIARSYPKSGKEPDDIEGILMIKWWRQDNRLVNALILSQVQGKKEISSKECVMSNQAM